MALGAVMTTGLSFIPSTGNKAVAAASAFTDCRCALLGGNDACSGANYGNSCSTSTETDCRSKDSNCSTSTGT
jgi:hypothetical protein